MNRVERFQSSVEGRVVRKARLLIISLLAATMEAFGQLPSILSPRTRVRTLLHVLLSLAAFLAIFLTTGASPVSADDPTFLARRKFGVARALASSVAVGDVDGDGDLDIVVGNYGQQSAVYLNDGAGNFTTERNFGTGSDSTYSVAVGDMDGDGDLDVVVGNYGQNVVYLNDGAGNFSTGRNFGTGSDSTSSVAVGNMDGDGDLDIVVGNANGGQNVVYLNDGAGNFPSGRDFGTGASSVAVGDMDGDGDLDIIVGSTNGGQNVVYLNDGAGNFPSGRDFGKFASSVAVGNMDGDGDLDIVVGNDVNQQSAVYLNDGAGNFTIGRNFGPWSPNTYSVAVGDMDGDGDLDVVVGNYGQNVVYLNDGAGNFPTERNFGTGSDYTHSVAVGDMDGDGDLDIVTGNAGQQSAVYLNDGAGHFPSGRNFGTGSDFTYSVAVGDMDGDGDLDIVVGKLDQSAAYLNDGAGNLSTERNFGTRWQSQGSAPVGDMDGDGDLDIVVGTIGQDVMYLNDGAGNFPTGRNFGSGLENTWAMAVGDVDGDGDLDIVGGYYRHNVVYLNDGAGNFSSGRNLGTGARSMAVGDMDGDGDLDIVVGKGGGQNVVYLNDGAGNFPTERDFGTESDSTSSVALGDMNGDGNLDIVVGKGGGSGGQNVVYLNDGAGNFPTGRDFGTGSDWTTSVAVGDMDGDGDLDIVVGNDRQQDVVYLNDGAGNFPSGRNFGTGSDGTYSVALGDMNGDGDLDIVVGNAVGNSGGTGGQNVVYLNDGAGNTRRLPNNPPRVAVARPGSANANFQSTPRILETNVIPITYTLFDPEGDRVRFVRAWYSQDGGGSWRPAVAATGTITTSLDTGLHAFGWDTFRSGFFGLSDNVVFRLEAYPDLYPRPRSVPGPYQHPYASATTFPFRVRGTQVRVVDEAGRGQAGALVYHRQGDAPATLMGGAEQPFRTASQGYLQGYGQLAAGDGLLALLPVVITDTHTLYHTSAPISDAGPLFQPVSIAQSLVQTLTVSAANPLILFNLDVALEWDASKDAQYISQLQADLRRTSEVLYDWTNGQAALGRTRIYHDAKRQPEVDGWQPWLDSHIRIYATNRLRPSAVQGGIVSQAISETLATTVTYGPGQVRMGAVWNRYGQPNGTLGEDWPRTLAHELGHYAFYLDDNYLGLDGDGLLKFVENCPGAISDPYRDDWSEFHPAADWLPACAETLSNRRMDRADWTTIQHFYPQLAAPPGTFEQTLKGPTSLPLAVTQVKFFTNTAVTTPPLDVPIFYLSQAGQRILPGSGARAFLFQEQQGWVTDLGRPTLDQLMARGARPGDRICLFELDQARLGCEKVTAGDNQLALIPTSGWQPEISVSPVTSRTMAITVTNVSGVPSLSARLYPVNLPAAAAISLTASTGSYTGTFDLGEPTFEGYLHIWADEAEPRREAVVDFTVGGNPGHVHSGVGHVHSGVGHVHSGVAPVMSADGQVILFAPDLELDPKELWFYTLQTTAVVRDTPPGRRVVGPAYRLVTSANAPSLRGTSLSISYLGSEVSADEEQWLKIYYSDGTSWQPLETRRDPYHNMTSAPAQGPGLYALMSGLEIPLAGPGWNLFAYPVAYTQTVPTALKPIESYYTVVWGYEPSTPAEPWRSYFPAVAGGPFDPLVNTLTELRFGQGYWIHMTEAYTLYLRTTPAAVAANAAGLALPPPPAAYYGPVLPDASFTPAVGLPVTAWIDGRLCGQSQTRELAGQIVYVLNVAADDGSAYDDCGGIGRRVTLQVAGVPMASSARWDNTEVAYLPLTRDQTYRRFLPLITKGR